jgi:hypothetical protein
VGEPPPPEDPPDWETYTPAKAGFTAQDLMIHEPDLPEEELPTPGGETAETAGSAVEQPVSFQPPTAVLTPKLPAATGSAKLDDDHAPQMVTVILRPTGDPHRDIRRISRLHGTFISHPGKDRFAFQIFEEGRGHLIEFPNDSTHLCAELAAIIKEAVGEENLRVEPILYQ